MRGIKLYKDLITDTAFAWFAKNQQGYLQAMVALREHRAGKNSIHILAFGGTGCIDTRFILPRVFVLVVATDLSPDHVTIFGVDHNKKIIQHFSKTFNITNLPTIIFLE